MKEWSNKNEFNSFNSWKGLLYSNWYEAIIDWRDGRRKDPLPPIEISIDPIHACNLHCEHCNAASYLLKDLKNRRMTDEHLINLVKFFNSWGVKALCYGGGGEPTLHTGLADALDRTAFHQIQASIATNGTKFSDDMKLAETAVRTCRWIGVSVDASTPETYKIGRKKDAFNDTCAGIRVLTDLVKEYKYNCDVAFKFLVFDYNQHEIFDACKLAKRLGVRDFHARPADFSHQGMGDLKKNVNPYDINVVLEQFERCHELEDEDFRVFTVVHKFNPDFTPKRDFSKCYAAPLNLQVCADGNCYFCVDQRHQEKYKIISHYPNPEKISEFWGSQKHYDMVFGNTAKKCKTRCTFGRYNKQCEVLFADNKNPMCWQFT